MGFEPTTFSLARRRSTTEPRPQTSIPLPAESAETQDRTGDTAIFSRVLYQLSYLGLYSVSEREDFTILGKIVKKGSHGEMHRLKIDQASSSTFCQLGHQHLTRTQVLHGVLLPQVIVGGGHHPCNHLHCQ